MATPTEMADTIIDFDGALVLKAPIPSLARTTL